MFMMAPDVEMTLAGKRDLQKHSVSCAVQLIYTPIDWQIMGKINKVLFTGCLLNRPAAFVMDTQN